MTEGVIFRRSHYFTVYRSCFSVYPVLANNPKMKSTENQNLRNFSDGRNNRCAIFSCVALCGSVV